MTRIDTLFLCSCEGSMAIDADTAKRATGAERVLQATELCGTDLDKVTTEAMAGSSIVACGQMASLFEDLWDDSEATGSLLTTDIRDRAGWTDDAAAHPKQAALLAEALLVPPSTPTKDVLSEGTCLILGRDDSALDVAARLADRLAVTCLLPKPPEFATFDARFDLACGDLTSAKGALGRFEIKVAGFRAAKPGGRGPVRFSDPTASVTSSCDIILDLRGATPLFPADHKRDGYVRVDPGDALAVERAIDETAQLQGVFEKPLYIRYDASICAHSRASQEGCNRCLNVCPTGAILPDGDTVAIDPMICAGCGACASVCPSGAASYDDPPVEFLFSRLRTLSSVYREAGGTAPRVLFHDSYGSEMIALSARFGRGLPADVIPVEVPNVEGVGHAELVAALAVGFAEAKVLAGPQSDVAVIGSQLELARALSARASGERLSLLSPDNPDALEDALRTDAAPALELNPILPVGGRREVTRLAAIALAGEDISPLPLPENAPYGAVAIDTDACTLCLACVSLCPVGALTDNAEKPQVRFQETACLQCGICESACPENAIALVPQLDPAKEAMVPRILNEEEPFECIECGKPFGVRSAIERIVEKLEGKHWMYTGSDNTKLIQMCDDCRVNAQYHQDGSPFAMGQRPQVRTTDDYLSEKKPN